MTLLGHVTSGTQLTRLLTRFAQWRSQRRYYGELRFEWPR